MQLNDLRVNLTLDNDGFKITVRDSERVLRQFGQRIDATATSVKKIETHMTSFTSKASRFIMTLGMARFALMDLNDIFLSLPRAVMKNSGEIERLTVLMEGLSTAATEAERKMEAASNVQFVFDMAKNAPFQVNAIADSFVKLKTAGLDPTNGSLQSLLDGIAKFGGSSEQLHRASIAIQQMSGKGVISMEELRQQLGEAIPTAMAAMATGMAMSMAELTKAVSDGTVASQMALSKMLAVMEIENAGAAKAMMGTWVGMLERLKTEWTLFTVEIGKEGMFDRAKAALDDLLGAAGSQGTASLARSIGSALDGAAEAVIKLTKTIIELWDYIKIAGTALVAYLGIRAVSPMFKAVGEGIDKVKGKILDAESALVSGRQKIQDNILANEAMMRETAKRVQADIAEERRLEVAKREMRAAELRDEIEKNRAIASVEAQRLEEMDRRLRKLRNDPAMLADRAGTASPMQANRASMLQYEIDAQRKVQREMEKMNAIRAQSIRQMDDERNSILRNIDAESEKEKGLKQSLQTVNLSAEAYKKKAGAINTVVTSGDRLRGTITGMKNSFMDLVGGVNGWVIAITAIAYAWDAVATAARKAEQASRDMMRMDDLNERGITSKEQVASAEAGLAANKDREKQLRESVAQYEAYEKKHGQLKDQAMRDGYIKAQNSLKNLEMQNAQYEASIKEGAHIAKVRNAELLAGDYAQQEVAAIIKIQGEANRKIQEYEKNALASGVSKEAIGDEKNKMAAAAQRATAEALVKLQDDYRKKLETVDATSEKAIAYNRRIDELAGQINQAQSKEGIILAPPDILGKTKKAKTGGKGEGGEHPLLAAWRKQTKALPKIENELNRQLGGIATLAEIKKRVDNELEGLVAGSEGKTFKKFATPAQVEELKAMMEKKEILKEIGRVYGDISGEIGPAQQKLAELQMAMMTGAEGISGAGSQENQIIRELEGLKARFPEAVAEIDKFIAKATEYRNVMGSQQATADAIENEKRIGDARINNIIDPLQKAQSARERELQQLQLFYQKQLQMAADNGADTTRLQEQWLRERQQLLVRHTNEAKTPMEKMFQSWEDMGTQYRDAQAQWVTSAADGIANMAAGGKASFKDMADSIIKDIMRIYIRKLITGLITGAFTGNTGAATTAAVPDSGAGITTTAFANGGIMNQYGSVPLRKYANGGIARSPQLALYGEGSMAEAYVPLPDGRSIPVSMQNGGGAPNVQVNVINQTGQQVGAQQGQPRFDGKQMILDVVLTAASQPGPFRDGMKGAMK